MEPSVLPCEMFVDGEWVSAEAEEDYIVDSDVEKGNKQPPSIAED